jgi:bis(5'-nucleosyl)-tetraphosphatase (symmetrical)
MATYAIGDVQGCFEPLMALLEAIQFDSKKDRIIFCGDLVNRGGRSLDVLRWAYAHQHCCDTVLGNHDLSLLNKYFNKRKMGANKEFNAIFKSSDSRLLLDWLLNRPLYIEREKEIIVHAGIYPFWDFDTFKALVDETRINMLNQPKQFFSTMYGNTPKKWSSELADADRFRFVINACTRMRFIKKNGSLNFTENRKIPKVKTLIPWFTLPELKNIEKHIIFGHWSALGYYHDEQVTCLDSGKVWGGQLTALRLEDHSIFSI